VIKIEVPDKNDSVVGVTLDGEDFFLRFTYNHFGEYWSLGLMDKNGETLLSGTKIVPYAEILRYYRYRTFPNGMFYVFSNVEKIGRDSFKNGETDFLFISWDEIGEIDGKLASEL